MQPTPAEAIRSRRLDPAIARQPAAQFLIRDAALVTEPAVVVFRLVAAATIVAGGALFGTALYRSGVVPRLAVALIGLGAVGYAAGFLSSTYLAVGGIVTLGVGCLLIGRTLWSTTASHAVQPTAARAIMTAAAADG